MAFESQPLSAVSNFAEGLLTLAFPLAVFLAVVAWYVVLVRRHHPE
jgi:hypothetical protein